MRAFWIALAVLCCAAVLPARADQAIASMQQALKDQGFYYGEITGTKDADTTAAIRRYQIRNGLKITGDLNAETQKSLGVRGSGAATATPPPQQKRSAPPAPAPQTVQPPDDDTADLRNEEPLTSRPPPVPRAPGFAPGPPQSGYAPAPGSYPATTGVFDGTPYQLAPLAVQRQVIASAQSRLAHQGYYRSAIDGSYGQGTAFALRAFQTRFRLQPSGRLDVETLAALGLLPGQRGPGMPPPRRRIYRPAGVVPGPDERVYIPR